MVMLPQSFNTADVADSEFEVIAPGIYEAMISESEMKATSSGDGAYIELKVQIVKGEKEGRLLFERLNVQNKNDKAVEIAYRTLKSICLACGKTNITDTNELHNKRFNIEVVVEKGKPYVKDGVQKDGSDQNRIKKYSGIGAISAPAAGTIVSSATMAGSTGSLPPWKKTVK